MSAILDCKVQYELSEFNTATQKQEKETWDMNTVSAVNTFYYT